MRVCVCVRSVGGNWAGLGVLESFRRFFEFFVFFIMSHTRSICFVTRPELGLFR